MGKKKINIRNSLIVLFVFSTICSYAQGSFIGELEWELQNPMVEITLQDTSEIIWWGMTDGSLATYETKTIQVKDYNVFILMVDVCFGLYCPFIFVFREEEDGWHLKTRTHVSLTEKFEIVVDNYREEIIFKIKSGQIVRLPFEMLD